MIAICVYKKSDLDRFWAKVQINSEDKCWPWLGKADFRGYGTISINGRNRRAHQVAWEIERGMAFPSGKVGCHACDNPPCVNPAHIWPGTQRENMHDAIAKGRLKRPPRNSHNKDKTNCKRGHPLVGDNLFITKQGSRSCRICLRMHRKQTAERNPRAVDPVKNRERARMWQIKNPEKAKARKIKWVEDNRQKSRDYQREYQRKLRAKKREQQAALTEAGVVKPTGQTVPSGYVEVPICELQPPFREPTQVDKLAERSSGREKGRAR